MKTVFIFVIIASMFFAGCSKKVNPNTESNELQKVKIENAALKAKIQKLQATKTEQQKNQQSENLHKQTKITEPNINSVATKGNVPAETKEDNLEIRINKKLGTSNISKGQRVNNILLQKDSNVLLILIEVNDNLTKNLIEHGWWNDAWDVLQIAYDDPKVQSDVMVQGFYPITDVYGNTKWKTVGAILLPRNDYQKINKQNFIPADLSKIAVGQFNINGIY